MGELVSGVRRYGPALGLCVATFWVMALEWGGTGTSAGRLWLLALSVIATAVVLCRAVVRLDPPHLSQPPQVLPALRGFHLTLNDPEPLYFKPLVTLPASLLILVAGRLWGGFEYLPLTLVLALGVLLLSAPRRPALLVLLCTLLVYVPTLGVQGLWDPWETHYAEVAREILQRRDWISLWWAQDGWFWSKPILIFWSEALSMGLLGFDTSPGEFLANVEWAVRLPVLLMAVAAVMAVFFVIRRVFHLRAAMVAAFVVATMPFFALMAHQAITDMPFVANMTIALCFLAAAVTMDPQQKLVPYRVGRWTFTWQHVVLTLLLVLLIPQALYLVTRNLSVVDGYRLTLGPDHFVIGSPGNGHVPGNNPLREVGPRYRLVFVQPVFQGLFWLLAGVLVLRRWAKESTAQSVLMCGFYVFCALSFMAKGIPGFALPGLVALLFLVTTRRWDVLVGGQLRVTKGMFTVAVLGMPWLVAMHIRHGPRFLKRLLVHDHINRLASGVHGDTGSIAYFLEQLGFGFFPWVAVVPAALGFGMYVQRHPEVLDRAKRDVVVLFSLWFFGAFALFSAMITKFHHYIFPATVPLAVLCGLCLERLMPAPRNHGASTDGRRALWSGLGSVSAGASGLLSVLGVGLLWGDVRGVAAPGAESTPDWVMGAVLPLTVPVMLLVLAAMLALASWWSLRRVDGHCDHALSGWYASLLVGVAVMVFVARDLSWVTSVRPQGYERFFQLFIYKYDRIWPSHLDFRPVLTGFGVTLCALFALFSLPAVRGYAWRAAFFTVAGLTVWTLHVYMPLVGQHWTQRHMVKTYYERRAGPSEPLVAWQLYWRGENFYTGNGVYAFMKTDNVEVKKWIEGHPGTTAYFLFERSRMNAFKSIMGRRATESVTDERVHNKFVLMRVRL